MENFYATTRVNKHNKNSPSQVDNESLSSVGSMESATVVANCFDDETSPPQSSHQASLSSRTTTSSDHSRKKSKSLHRECPHCKKRLSSYHAVTTHLRIHDRAGEFHCAKCTFKSRTQDELKAHEKKHRTCPHCGKLFTHLHKHKLSCMKSKTSQ